MIDFAGGDGSRKAEIIITVMTKNALVMMGWGLISLTFGSLWNKIMMGTNMCAYILLSPCGCDNLYSIFVQLIWCLSASSGGIFCFGREFHLVHGSSASRSRLGAMGLTGTGAWNFLWSVLKSIWARFFWYSGYIVLDLKASSCDSFLCLIILKVYLELFHIL